MTKLKKNRNMLALVATAILALTDLSPAGESIPLAGLMQGAEITTVQDATFLIDGLGVGMATHLGRFQIRWTSLVNALDLSGVGGYRLIAANGNVLVTENRGQAEPTAMPGFLHIVERNTITGGTGRFAGATGSFTLERLLNLTTGTTVGRFKGTVTLSIGKP